jgi:hypothetical protein
MGNMKARLRILIVADISAKAVKMFLDQMPKLAKGFIRLGNDVRFFGYNAALMQASPIKSRDFAAKFFKSRVDRTLADRIANYCPDIVYVSFARSIDGSTVLRMRQAAPNAVFIGGDGDPWPQLQANRIDAAKQLDVLTATNNGQFLQTYRDAGVRSCVFLPNMCDPDTDHPYDVADRWKTDILWTGKPGHHAGSNDMLREQLVTRLNQQQGCALYGCFDRPKIGGMDYLHAISGARIGVNVNVVNSVSMYHSDRLTHYLACGAFVLAKRVPDTDLLFKDRVHLKYFDTVEEFLKSQMQGCTGHTPSLIASRSPNTCLSWSTLGLIKPHGQKSSNGFTPSRRLLNETARNKQ